MPVTLLGRLARRATERPMSDHDLSEQSQNPVKDPADWPTGDEPMTGPRGSYLQTLL